MAKAQIERYWGNRCLTPALRALGQSRQIAARRELEPHRESNIEIHLIMDGSVNWWVEGQEYHLPPDSIFVTQPQELHGGVKNMVQPSSLLWLQLKPDRLLDAKISQELVSLPSRNAMGAAGLKHYLEAMLAECRAPQQDSSAIVQANLQLFLAHLLRCYRRSDDKVEYPPLLRNMLSLIESNLTETLSVNALCAHVNLSRSRVFQMFDQHIGQSPISYMMAQKIAQAKQQLRESDDSITLIAQSLGFSSSQHFATTFKRVTGITPSAFRRE